VEDALALTGVGPLAERPMHTLSGGERQMVFLAAALAQDARILLLDEPTTFLDPRHRDEFRTVLRTINRSKGVTIVEVTHDVNCAALDADRVYALKQGRTAFYGPPEQFMTPDVLRDVFDRRFVFAEHPQTGALVVVPEVELT
jgi:iron complex transport system ATP-binding protein